MSLSQHAAQPMDVDQPTAAAGVPPKMRRQDKPKCPDCGKGHLGQCTNPRPVCDRCGNRHKDACKATCRNCGRVGHAERYCWRPKPQQRPQQRAEREPRCRPPQARSGPTNQAQATGGLFNLTFQTEGQAAAFARAVAGRDRSRSPPRRQSRAPPSYRDRQTGPPPRSGRQRQQQQQPKAAEPEAAEPQREPRHEEDTKPALFGEEQYENLLRTFDEIYGK
ncbi:MAG: hypothetical protein M1819_003423 [Sarea resinae]|nr:MAG: hypothetical protein M1819_003423 [Sarea resinae]